MVSRPASLNKKMLNGEKYSVQRQVEIRLQWTRIPDEEIHALFG